MVYIRITLLAATQELINNRMSTLIHRAEKREISYFGPYNYHQESRGDRTYWRQAIGFRDRESAIRDALDISVPDYLYRYVEAPRTSEETDIVDMESKSPDFPLPEINEGDDDKKSQNDSGEITTSSGTVTGLDNIEKLRKQVKDSGDEKSSVSTTSNTNSTQEYSRSSSPGIRESTRQWHLRGMRESCPLPHSPAKLASLISTHIIYTSLAREEKIL